MRQNINGRKWRSGNLKWRCKVMVKVEVDHEKCNGDAICVDVCPVSVFELKELPNYPGQQKSVVVDNDACLVCRACEVQCPTQAITVTE